MNSWLARLGALLAALLLAVVFSCQNNQNNPQVPPTEAPRPPVAVFEDVTSQSGVDFTYRNGEEADHYVLLEAVGGGVGLIDYDGDGLLDIVLTGGGHFEKSTDQARPHIRGYPSRLYRNLGNFKFQDVTHEAGLDEAPFYSHGIAVCDYDRDGWPDLLVTGYGRIALYRNVAGPGGGRRFVDVTKEAGLLTPHFWGTSAAWADFDGDGFADLYVCQYANWSWDNNPPCYNSKGEREVCPPRMYQAVPHLLFRNDGKGHFINVTAEAGIRTGRKDGDHGNGLGVVVVDVNGDRKPDIFVANDATGNFLYMNKSLPGKILFDETAQEMGVALDDRGVATAAMGADAADFDRSGLPSLWCTNFENQLHGLYRNILRDGRQHFLFASQAAGIATIGPRYVGFGTGFVDIDNDGWEDIAIANGHVDRRPYPGKLQQQPILFLNEKGSFKDISGQGGSYFGNVHRGRGLAIGDLNNDGWPDVVISHLNEPVAILKNTAAAANHWIGVELAGLDKRNLVGTKLILEANGQKLTRFVKGGGSYLSAGDPRQIFGLGSTTDTSKLTVEWVSGEPAVECWYNLTIDNYHRLVQGKGSRGP